MASMIRKGFLVVLLSLIAEGTAVGAAPDLIPTAPSASGSVVTQHQEEVSWTV